MKSAGLRDTGVLRAPAVRVARRGGTSARLEGTNGVPRTMIARPSTVRSREARHHRRKAFDLAEVLKFADCASADVLDRWLGDCSRLLGFSGASYIHAGHLPSDALHGPEGRPARSLAVGSCTPGSIPAGLAISDRFLPFAHRARGEAAGESWLVVPVQDYAAGSAWLAFMGQPVVVAQALDRHGPELAYAAARFHGFARELLPCSATGSGKGLTEREMQCLRYAAQGLTLERIAQAVGIATRTVEFHLTNAARKLGAVNKINAVAIATAAGLVRP